jgi:sarcosine oxidase subunit gamma
MNMSLATQNAGLPKAGNFPERAPLYPRHAHAALLDLGHTVLVDHYGEDKDIGRGALADLTNLPRLGLRGKAAADFIATLGYRVPDRPNQLLRQRDGVALLRLSLGEFMFLGSFADQGARIRELEQQAEDGPGLYWLLRQDSHAWFWLGGSGICEVMAKLCGVDLSPEAFATGSIAQTSVARINAIVANTGSAAYPAFQLLFDRPSAPYFWEALLDALQEFDGQPAGFSAVVRYDGQAA